MSDTTDEMVVRLRGWAVSKNNSEYSEIADEIEALRGDMNDLREENTSLTGDRTDLRTRVEELEREIEELNDSLKFFVGGDDG